MTTCEHGAEILDGGPIPACELGKAFPTEEEFRAAYIPPPAPPPWNPVAEDPPIFQLQASPTWAPALGDGSSQRLIAGAAGTVVTMNADGSVGWSPPPTGPGLQYLTGGGTITATTISTAQAAGWQGIFLDPRFVWDMSGLVINGVKNFIIESRMAGSIGWLGNIAYNATGYITTSTASPQDGIQVYASAPSSNQTQGVVFRNCVIVGNNSRAVLHFGGGQRKCGLVDCLVYNTNSAAGAYGVVIGSGLSDNNSEDNFFHFAGAGGLAGAYAALGIGVADQTQRANDTLWQDLTTAGGTYSIVTSNGSNHTFTNYYDRSAPTTATVHNTGSILTFYGGEDSTGSSASGVAHLLDGANSLTILQNRTVSVATSTNTIQVSAGNLISRGRTRISGGAAMSGTGSMDLSDPTGSYSSMTVTGSAGTVMLAGSYPLTSGAPNVSGFTGTITYPSPPVVVVQQTGTALTTTQTVTWTPPTANVGFRVSVMIHPTVAGTSTVPVLAFSEFGSTARSYTVAMWQQNGSAAAPSYTCAAVDTFIGEVVSRTDNSGTALTVTITPTGSTFRYQVVIERLTS